MPKEKMAQALRREGIRVSVGHYALRLSDFDRFSFEQYGGDLGDPMIQFESTNVEKLIAAVIKISEALKRADIAHYLEVFDEIDDDIFQIEYNAQALREKNGDAIV